MKILIADDEFNNRALLKEILDSYGECDMVVNGAEAVEIFESQLANGEPYDLILMDIMMPEMSGQDAALQIRKLEKKYGVVPRDEVVLIMISALDSPKDVVQAFYSGGCTDYITKPFTRQQLLTKLRMFKLIL